MQLRRAGRRRAAADGDERAAAAVAPKTLEVSRARTQSLAALTRKVEHAHLARALAAGSTFYQFLESLPEVLAGRDLRDLARRIALAHRRGHPWLLMMGAHALKVGLGPVICDLMRRGVLNALATNGAAMVHDFELAFGGRTSEDVGAGLADGSFGMAEETGTFLNRVAGLAAREHGGLGEILGREILQAQLKFGAGSIFACAYQAGIQATVHVTLGADIVHMHPSADGAAIGAATMSDFHRLVAFAATLSRGVVINLGSAVVMPEVFLKALNLARNLGHRVSDFTAADMDFVRQYRPRMNVVERPTAGGGRGFMLTGHHEIMFPLLAAAVSEELSRQRVGRSARASRARRTGRRN